MSVSSKTATAAAAADAIEKDRLAHERRDWVHTSRCTPASARQMPAMPDQITVIQLIAGEL